MADMTKVFLSSTVKDLKDHREAAKKAINGSPDCHCVCMEEFPADKRQAEAYCRERVRECEVFVGVFGLVYGSGPGDDERSYTEIEYDEALHSCAHCHIFVSSDEFALAGSLREDDTCWRKQQALRERVMKAHVCATFSSPDGLAARVSQALAHLQLALRPRSPAPSSQPATVASDPATSTSAACAAPASEDADTLGLDYLTGTVKLQHMVDDLRQRVGIAELLGEAGVADDLSVRAGRLEALLPITRADYGMVQLELLDIAIDSCGDMSVVADPDEFIDEAPPSVLQQWIAAKQSGLFDHFTLYLVAEIPDRDDEFLRIHGGYVVGHKDDHCFWVTSWW